MYYLTQRCHRLGYIPPSSILADTIELTCGQWARLMTCGVEPDHWPAVLEHGFRRIKRREPTGSELENLVQSATVESIQWKKSLVIESERYDADPPPPPSGFRVILSPFENEIEVPEAYTLAAECEDIPCQMRAWDDCSRDYGSDSAQWIFYSLIHLVNSDVLPESAIVLVQQIQSHQVHVEFRNSESLVARIAGITADLRPMQS